MSDSSFPNGWDADRTRRVLLVFAIVIAAEVLSACGTRDPLQDIVRRPPSIRGTITHVQPGPAGSPRAVVRIEERPQQLSGDQKAVVTIGPATLLYQRTDGRLSPIELSQVRTGSRVDAWFEGPVAESYPVQAGASLLVIDSDPADDEPTQFRTDSLSYTLREDPTSFRALIGVTFTNRTADTVHFVNCNGATGVSLEKLTDGAWKPVWSPAMPACLSPPIVVPPGATRAFPIDIFAGRPGTSTFPQFATEDIPGVYRAVWAPVKSYQDRLPFGDPLPLAQRVSNRFSLHAARR